MARKKTTNTTSTADRATEYAKRVVAGKVVAGPHVRNACRRHLDDLKAGHARGLHYHVDAADRAIQFFETQLKLSEGQFEGEPLILHESQAFIVGSLFGWKRADGTRRFRRAYIEQGKGNGKSPLVGGVGLFGLMADREKGAQIYSAGATKDQAGILFADAIKMRDQSPAIKKRTRTSGGPGREFNLANINEGSFFKPISRETRKTGSGPRPHMALCDELHEHPDGGVLEMLERGFKFRRQPMLVMITNSGSDRNSVCWVEHDRAVKVAAGNPDAKDADAHYLGEPIGDEQFSYVCALDPDDDPLTDPSCWIKANPLLGVTITEEYLAGVVKQGRDMPSKLNNIQRLHFCQWTEAETAWMTRKTLEPALVDFEPLDLHSGAKVWLGADLSQVKDITALGYCVESGTKEVEVVNPKTGEIEVSVRPVYDAWIQAWTPRDTMAARSLADQLPYEEWVRAGHLQAPKGQVIDYLHVAQALAEAQHDFNVQCLAYDRYAFSRMLEPRMQDLGLKIECVEHPQGGTKKGAVTETMKAAAKAAKREAEGLWMPMSVRLVEQLLLEGRLRLQNNLVLVSAMMSAVTAEDRWGNYWLAKERAKYKIDAAVALCMAVGAACAHEAPPKREISMRVI